MRIRVFYRSLLKDLFTDAGRGVNYRGDIHTGMGFNPALISENTHGDKSREKSLIGIFSYRPGISRQINAGNQTVFLISAYKTAR